MHLELTIGLLLWATATASDDHHIVAHYRRSLRLRERRQRRDTGVPYWGSAASPHVRQRFWPEQSAHLDLYIYAPAKHTVKPAGESVYFDCELTDGYSATWSREHGERFSPFTETKKLPNRNIYRIDIENLDASDSGKYVCAANTGNPEDRESIYLEVRGQRKQQPAPQERYPHVDEMARKEHERALEQQRMELYRQRLEEERERERKLEEQYRAKEAQEDKRAEWPEEAKHRQQIEEEQRRQEDERRRLQEHYQTERHEGQDASMYTDREIYLTDEGDVNHEDGTEAAENDQHFSHMEANDQHGREPEHPYFQRNDQTMAEQAKQLATDATHVAAHEDRTGKAENAFTAANGDVYSDYVYDYMMDE